MTIKWNEENPEKNWQSALVLKMFPILRSDPFRAGRDLSMEPALLFISKIFQKDSLPNQRRKQDAKHLSGSVKLRVKMSS